MIPADLVEQTAAATDAQFATCADRPDCSQCRDVHARVAAVLEAALPRFRRLVRAEVADEFRGTATALRTLADIDLPADSPVAEAETLRARADLLEREARSLTAYAPGQPTEWEVRLARRDQALERQVRARVADEIASSGMSLRESADTASSKTLRAKWSAAAKVHEDLAERMRSALELPAPPARPTLEVLHDLVADRIRHAVRIRLGQHSATAAQTEGGVILSGTEADQAADAALAAIREHGCGCDLDSIECNHEAARGAAEAEATELRQAHGPAARLDEQCGGEFQHLRCTLPKHHTVHFARGSGTTWEQLRPLGQLEALAPYIRQVLTAQGRILDEHAEAGTERRRELWTALHESADGLRDALYETDLAEPGEPARDRPRPDAAAPDASPLTVYVSVGNSDDKLSQKRWAELLEYVNAAIWAHADQIHGEWFSSPTAPFQNACVCFEISEQSAEDLRDFLAAYADRYGQDSIAWAVADKTEFITAANENNRERAPHAPQP